MKYFYDDLKDSLIILDDNGTIRILASMSVKEQTLNFERPKNSTSTQAREHIKKKRATFFKKDEDDLDEPLILSRKSRTEITPAMKRRAEQMFEMGASGISISEELGISLGSVIGMKARWKSGIL